MRPSLRSRALGRLAVSLAALWAAAAVLLVRPGTAGAHPAGISSVNRYLGAELGPGPALRLAYMLDFAELPAYGEIERLDADHDGSVTPAERDAYLDRLLPPIVARWTVAIDGVPVTPRVVHRALEAPPGQGGLSTLRILAELNADLPPGAASRAEWSVRLTDPNYQDRPGWRELGADDSGHGAVVASSVPRRRAAPLAYDAQAATRAPRVDDATFTFRRAASASQPAGARPGGPGASAVPRAGGSVSEVARLAALVREGRGGASFVLAALALAFALGAGHAMSPGHGKALVAAYLVGTRGTLKHALALGATVTATHTASVFAMGVLALGLERSVGSDRLLRWLELASGATIAAVALWQLPRRLRAARRRTSVASVASGSTSAPAGAMPSLRIARVTSARRTAGFGVRAAGRPARANHHHHHHHHHGTMDEAAHARAHAREIAAAARGRWREIIALGASGGLVPCPGALVVLLTAIALHRVGLGLALITAFSLGLAFVLTALGALFVLARRALDRFAFDGPLARALPVASSIAVLSLGVTLCVSAWVRA